MYKLHLILKYLRKRRIAWVSLIAVMLCTTMVLVVISVMGGWLRMFRESFHGLSGDVLVQSRALSGFPHYQEMIARIEALPEVAAAVPTIETFGLVKVGPLDPNGVRVFGFPLERIGQVNSFPQTLYRQSQHRTSPGDIIAHPGFSASERAALYAPSSPSFRLPLPPEVYRDELPKMRNADPSRWPGMVVSANLVGIRKGPDGRIMHRVENMYTTPAKLTVMGVESGAPVDMGNKAERYYWIVDDSRTGIWQYDESSVYVPFDVLQQDLGMAARPEENLPARTSAIQVRVKAGYDLDQVRDRIEPIVQQVLDEHGVSFAQMPLVQTWEQSQSTWLNAVEHEKVLVTFLFAIISVVAIFLIFCIFYMIVVEKTRDIGIVKSVGATSRGVAGIFLGYGAAIGIVGAGLGLLVGWLIVRNINYLHTKMGQLMGIQIWNPEIYAFDKIPNTMDGREVTVIVAVAIVASVLGALVPAIRAARLHPVEALRWE